MFPLEGVPPNIPPTIIEQAPKTDVFINMYTRLLKERIIWLGSPIDAQVANATMAQLLFLEHEDAGEDIIMYINSPGGSIDDTMGIYDTMQFIQPDVVTLCAGNSYGMATILLAAGAKGKRYALPNAVIHHNAATEGYSAYAPNVQVQDKHLQNLKDKVNRTMAHHTGQPIEKIAADFQRDQFFTAEEAQAYGFIDEIISRSPGN